MCGECFVTVSPVTRTVGKLTYRLQLVKGDGC